MIGYLINELGTFFLKSTSKKHVTLKIIDTLNCDK